MPELVHVNMTRKEAATACVLAYMGLLRDDTSHQLYLTTSGKLSNCISYMITSDHVLDAKLFKDARLENGVTYAHPLSQENIDTLKGYFESNLPTVSDDGIYELTYRD